MLLPGPSMSPASDSTARRTGRSPRCGAVRGSPGSSCRAAASGCAARPCRPASPSRARGSRCGGCGEPRCARRGRRRTPPEFHLHQAVRGEADHLAQERRVGALLQQLAKRDLLIGHRGDLQVSFRVRPPPDQGAPGLAAILAVVVTDHAADDPRPLRNAFDWRLLVRFLPGCVCGLPVGVYLLLNLDV